MGIGPSRMPAVSRSYSELPKIAQNVAPKDSSAMWLEAIDGSATLANGCHSTSSFGLGLYSYNPEGVSLQAALSSLSFVPQGGQLQTYYPLEINVLIGINPAARLDSYFGFGVNYLSSSGVYNRSGWGTQAFGGITATITPTMYLYAEYKKWYGDEFVDGYQPESLFVGLGFKIGNV